MVSNEKFNPLAATADFESGTDISGLMSQGLESSSDRPQVIARQMPVTESELLARLTSRGLGDGSTVHATIRELLASNGASSGNSADVRPVLWESLMRETDSESIAAAIEARLLDRPHDDESLAFGDIGIRVKPLGQGTFGSASIIWRSREKDLVVAKESKIPMGGDAQILQRFNRERELFDVLTGKFVTPDLRAHGVLEDEAGARYPYFLLEYLQGQSLDHLYNAGDKLSSRFIGNSLVTWLLMLKEFERLGIAHRDLKPGNMLVAEIEARYRFLDLGLAFGEPVEDMACTGSGTIAGTPTYMAPEQFADFHGAGTPADMYSLGCIAFEGETGRPPFIGTSAVGLAAMHMNDKPQLDLISDPVQREVIGRLLAKQPAQRGEIDDLISRLMQSKNVDIDDGIGATVLRRKHIGQLRLRMPDISSDGAEVLGSEFRPADLHAAINKLNPDAAVNIGMVQRLLRSKLAWAVLLAGGVVAAAGTYWRWDASRGRIERQKSIATGRSDSTVSPEAQKLGPSVFFEVEGNRPTKLSIFEEDPVEFSDKELMPIYREGQGDGGTEQKLLGAIFYCDGPKLQKLLNLKSQAEVPANLIRGRVGFVLVDDDSKQKFVTIVSVGKIVDGGEGTSRIYSDFSPLTSARGGSPSSDLYKDIATGSISFSYPRASSQGQRPAVWPSDSSKHQNLRTVGSDTVNQFLKTHGEMVETVRKQIALATPKEQR